MYKSVEIHTDTNKDTIEISSKPDAYFIFFFAVCLIGICSLPFTKYHKDYYAYIGVLYMLVLTIFYFVKSLQKVIFENTSNIKIRKGFDTWNIPFESVTGGYTSYYKKTSRASLERTHFLTFELKTNLTDNPKHFINNGKASIFNYGFRHWGEEQEKIRDKFNDILNEKGIPNLTQK